MNNADDPPFATLISVNKATGALTVGARITFNAANGVDATNGAEQPVWDKGTGKFYISIPQIGSKEEDGAVVRIDPHSTGHVDAVFPVKFCQPAGLTLGPQQHLLLGCGTAFDTAGGTFSATDANSAAPVSIVLDATTGNVVATVKGVTGSDEVWFNRGDDRYYLAARNNPGGPAANAVTPVLGVIDAESNTLVQLVPTINGAANVASVDTRFPAPSAHSVAADSHNNHVFVPLGANNVFPGCLKGCIAIFGSPAHAED